MKTRKIKNAVCFLLPMLSVLFPEIIKAQTVQTVFDNPAHKITDAIIFDKAGNLYGSDYSGNAVYKISSDFQVSEVFVSGLNTPNGLAFDSNENLYVADNAGNRIYKFSYSGQPLDTIMVTNPSGIIKMPDSDTMIFTQYTQNKISKLAPDGTISLLHSGVPLDGPVGLAYDEYDNLYIANFTNRKVFRAIFDATFQLEFLATVPSSNGQSGRLGFIAYANGWLWATGFDDHKIYTVNPFQLGETHYVAGTTFGSQDGIADSAKFASPNGVIASLTGDSIFISDYNTGKIRMISDPVNAIADIDDAFKIDVFPNPASDVITITTTEELQQVTISLVDVLGIQQYHYQGDLGTEHSISIEYLPVGSYFLVLSNEGFYQVKSVVKQH